MDGRDYDDWAEGLRPGCDWWAVLGLLLMCLSAVLVLGVVLALVWGLEGTWTFLTEVFTEPPEAPLKPHPDY